MNIFKLPDLGEGLPDAVIREWHVAEGDSIGAHDSLVTVETAKALVEVPAPRGGIVEKLYAAEGDTVEVGQPLVGFADGGAEARQEAGEKTAPPEKGVQAGDAGTVVGRIQGGSELLGSEQAPGERAARRATPGVRALARRLGIDLARHQPREVRFTEAEVRRLAGDGGKEPALAPSPDRGEPEQAVTGPADSPARRAMALAMTRSRDQVTPMTLSDEVDISAWWGRESATLRLVRAVQQACGEEPNLNATYEDGQLRPARVINIGLAVDSPRGLFVPVLRDVVNCTDNDLLRRIEDYKEQARDTGIAREDLQGSTILLSNFGALGGRYATPVVMPPTVAIVGAGRTHEGVVAVGGKAAVRPLLPLSVSADHRAVTGGELARFLQALVRALAR
ncbi:dihydrolipoamide acetyltransferase family protein [Microbulbifer sediminum]|uniref:dihydrolipoamide acetyltransferase family protein n=1 Tax=Microbulbifer sediminum TaxID=2904250 RepID=UPI001F200130|nr:dihydrolipoamide acetyltransferase family protein [Microbulbifer sediminum]